MKPPLFYSIGVGEVENKTTYRKLVAKLPILHKAAMKVAEKMVASMPSFRGEKLVLQHKPEL